MRKSLNRKRKKEKDAVDVEVTPNFDVEYSYLSVTYQTQLKSLDVDDPSQQVGEY